MIGVVHPTPVHVQHAHIQRYYWQIQGEMIGCQQSFSDLPRLRMIYLLFITALEVTI
jgi:hypothetical protein